MVDNEIQKLGGLFAGIKAMEAVPIQGGIAGIFTMADFLFCSPSLAKGDRGDYLNEISAAETAEYRYVEFIRF